MKELSEADVTEGILVCLFWLLMNLGCTFYFILGFVMFDLCSQKLGCLGFCQAALPVERTELTIVD